MSGFLVFYISSDRYLAYCLLRGTETASRRYGCFEAICRQQDKSKLQCVFFRSSCHNVYRVLFLKKGQVLISIV